MLFMASLVVLLAAYLAGSIPVGVWVGKALGFDPRAVGSGNIGTANVARAGGKGAAALTFAGDLLKGWLPVMCGYALHVTPWGLALIALAAFAGAIYSIFLGFSGGRGVATGFGIWLALAPPVAMGMLVVFGAALWALRIVSVASIAGAVSLPIMVALSSYPQSFVSLAVVMAILVIWRHRANIGRLLSGNEPGIGIGDKRSAA